MRAHIVGGGFGGLAAAALLIRNAGVSGEDITIYEADERMGGGFFLGGSAESGYNLPGSVFDKEFRCTFELLKSIPSASNPSISVTDEFFAFNTGERTMTGCTSSIATAASCMARLKCKRRLARRGKLYE
jgi:oleate hydratase